MPGYCAGQSKKVGRGNKAARHKPGAKSLFPHTPKILDYVQDKEKAGFLFPSTRCTADFGIKFSILQMTMRSGPDPARQLSVHFVLNTFVVPLTNI